MSVPLDFRNSEPQGQHLRQAEAYDVVVLGAGIRGPLENLALLLRHFSVEGLTLCDQLFIRSFLMRINWD